MTVVTGFSSFPGVELNPTGILVEKWSRVAPEWASGDTHFELLPVVYASAGARIAELAADGRIENLIMLGVSAGSEAIRLERFAFNYDDTATPDSAGEVRQGKVIDETGPHVMEAGYDMEAARKSFLATSIETHVSDSAGRYLCNHCYHVALRSAERKASAFRPVFLHVPQVIEAHHHAPDPLTDVGLTKLEEELGILIPWFREN